MTSLKFLLFLRGKLETPYVVSYKERDFQRTVKQ